MQDAKLANKKIPPGGGIRLMTNAKLPDALRLSGLRSSCNILNLHDFVGRIRRSRRIRHKQSARC
ncbi:hypothetical protein BMT89_07920 [Escherichia coli]|nr:hypothetical protein BMT89_07920 [Escherichia coli]OOJ42249.1 hypothetical protein BMT79_10645 [Escherichia coli]